MTTNTHSDETDGSHLSVERLFAGQLVLQFIFYVVERRRLPLGAEVPADKRSSEQRRTVSERSWTHRGGGVGGGRGGRITNLRSNVVILSSMSSL